MSIKYKRSIVFLILVMFIIGSITIPNFTAKTQNITLTEDDEEIKTNIYDLLIITPIEFEKFLKPLEAHKNKFGVKTKIITLNEIYDEYTIGRDKPEQIKYAIKDAYDDYGIKYVLLVGSNKKMPVRYVNNQDMTYSAYLEPYFISELYYADLYNNEQEFQTWDTDEDAVFGEWIVNQTDGRDAYLDLHPDVYVGRLACKNIFEVIIMVDKIIKYETRTYGSTWFNDFVVVAGDTYPEGDYEFNTSGYEGEENTERAIENMTDFNPIRLWVSNGNFTGPKDVINQINKGCGFMFFEGHASPLKWGTHEYNSDEFLDGLANTDMYKLLNFYKLPVVVAGACHNAQFDITPVNLIKYGLESFRHGTFGLECWAWRLTSKPFGGSIATIANTGLGMSKEDKKSMEGAGDYMDKQFFYVYGNKESDILGECWGKSIDRYINAYPVNWTISDSSEFVYDHKYDLKTVQQWTLLGDPSLKIGGYN